MSSSSLLLDPRSSIPGVNTGLPGSNLTGSMNGNSRISLAESSTAGDDIIEMDDSITSSAMLSGAGRTTSGNSPPRTEPRQDRYDDNEEISGFPGAGIFKGMARHTLGLILLLFVVFLWTLSNFLGSSIFADNSYAKPFFLTYLNTSMFLLPMIPTLARSAWQLKKEGRIGETIVDTRDKWRQDGWKGLFQHEDDDRHEQSPIRESRSHDEEDALAGEGESEGEAFLKPIHSDQDNRSSSPGLSRERYSKRSRTRRKRIHLGLIPTARLSLAFCILWFLANYFAMACLQYTTVASTTILTSTSSVWTLLIGAITGIEKFTWRKLLGVVGSLVGIILISRVDLSSSTTDDVDPSASPSSTLLPVLHTVKRAIDPFPDKTPAELALGDFLALLSALIYGIYTITLKRTSLRAAPLSLNMPLFFGLVGFFNCIFLSPLFPVLHYTGAEKFELPPTRRIWLILIVNSIGSLLGDICWAYAMVLTSPLMVTVGMSLTIPLSLVGEMVLQGRYEGWIYWIGAGIVVGSFVFVDREERDDETETKTEAGQRKNTDVGDIDAVLDGGPGPEIRTSFDDRDFEDEEEETLLVDR